MRPLNFVARAIGAHGTSEAGINRTWVTYVRNWSRLSSLIRVSDSGGYWGEFYQWLRAIVAGLLYPCGQQELALTESSTEGLWHRFDMSYRSVSFG
jgi:hypothetical protein